MPNEAEKRDSDPGVKVPYAVLPRFFAWGITVIGAGGAGGFVSQAIREDVTEQRVMIEEANRSIRALEVSLAETRRDVGHLTGEVRDVREDVRAIRIALTKNGSFSAGVEQERAER